MEQTATVRPTGEGDEAMWGARGRGERQVGGRPYRSLSLRLYLRSLRRRARRSRRPVARPRDGLSGCEYTRNASVAGVGRRERNSTRCSGGSRSTVRWGDGLQIDVWRLTFLCSLQAALDPATQRWHHHTPSFRNPSFCMYTWGRALVCARRAGGGGGGGGGGGQPK